MAAGAAGHRCFTGERPSLGVSTPTGVDRPMTPPFIFQTDIQRVHSEDAAAIHSVMARYYQGVEEARVDLLAEVFHPDWLMKDTDTPGAATLNVEDKAAFIERVRGHGPYPGYAAGRRVVTVSAAHDRLASVRVDKNESCSSTVFMFCKVGSTWSIMDKVWVNPRLPGVVPRPMAPVLEAVSTRFDDYFRALASVDRSSLETLLHERWEMKSIGRDGIIVHDIEEVLDGRIEPSGSTDHSQLVSIEIFQEKMAVIRVDLPAREETRFMVMLRVGDPWQFVLERRSRKDV